MDTENTFVKPAGVPSFVTLLMESFGLGRGAAMGVGALLLLGMALAALFFVHSSPPSTITISSGPEGSVFYTNAIKYARILKRQGVSLKILTSQGSLANLDNLSNPLVKADVGFVLGGVTNNARDKVYSLGSMAYQPLLVFYRGETANTLSGFAGKSLALGSVGSGTRNLALMLLAANGIKPGESTTLLDWDSVRSAQALLDGAVDAVFLMGEDASGATMRQLLTAPGIQVLSFSQAEAYTRRFAFLGILKLPQGGVDFGKNVPAHDVYLIGPTVELIARRGLHPALSDLLLQAAQEVHGNATLLQRKGEFPAPLEHDFPISPDAVRFYKSGAGFFYRYLPFWMASLTSRILVIFVPMLVVLIPIVRSIPHVYRWRNQQRIYRWYRALLLLERDLSIPPVGGKRDQLLKRLDEIESEVNKMKVPAFLADQYYGLRGHINFVRLNVGKSSEPL